jgi:hypothetical protein
MPVPLMQVECGISELQTQSELSNIHAKGQKVTQDVTPAGNAGVQKPRMAQACYIPVLWIPAIPAEMTA